MLFCCHLLPLESWAELQHATTNLQFKQGLPGVNPEKKSGASDWGCFMINFIVIFQPNPQNTAPIFHAQQALQQCCRTRRPGFYVQLELLHMHMGPMPVQTCIHANKCKQSWEKLRSYENQQAPSMLSALKSSSKSL